VRTSSKARRAETGAGFLGRGSQPSYHQLEGLGALKAPQRGLGQIPSRNWNCRIIEVILASGDGILSYIRENLLTKFYTFCWKLASVDTVLMIFFCWIHAENVFLHFFCKKWVTSQATCARVWNEARMLESHTECVRLVGSGLLHGDGLGLWTVWQRVWIGWRDPTEFMNAANIARRRAIINLRPQDIRKKTSLSVQHQCLISLQANDAYHCVLVGSSSARVGRGNEWEDNGLTRQSIISAATLTTKHGKYWEKHARNA